MKKVSKTLIVFFIGLNLFSCTSEKPPPIREETLIEKISRKPDPNQKYSSLILDCRGLGIRPAMSPNILDESDSSVYPGGIKVDIDYLMNKGIVTYEYGTISNALKNERAGNNPLLIKADKAGGINSFDAILKQDNAGIINKINEKSKFLDNYKVIFLLDKK